MVGKPSTPRLTRYKPSPRNCMLLVLRLLEDKGDDLGKPLTRARLAAITLKRLWNRERLTEHFLAEIQDWLLTAGWALIDVGSTYAAVKIDVVENWPRVSSKRIDEELRKVGSGDPKYFADLEERLLTKKKDEDDDWAELDALLEEEEVQETSSKAQGKG
jgi:hypothetical protein